MTPFATPADLDAIRRMLKSAQLDGYILPRGDEFLGEYVAPYAERLAWLTGFTGSAGLAVLMHDSGAVFSDGRYTEQLQSQLDPDLWIFGSSLDNGAARWAASRGSHLRLGYDPCLVSSGLMTGFQSVDSTLTLVPMDRNPIDSVWLTRPTRPNGPVSLHGLCFSGQTSEDKRRRVGEILSDNGQDAAVITDPTCLAWLLNLRGNDVPYTPVALGFGIIENNGEVKAFIHPERLPNDVGLHTGAGVRFLPPADLAGALEKYAGKKVRLDPDSASIWFHQKLESIGASCIRQADPCHILKAVKNEVELSGARDIQQNDSAALCQFLHFVHTNGVGKSESALADHLVKMRSLSPSFREESFPAISASGPNAALPHYRALPDQDRILGANEIYLVDSGGQYPAGTTDVTRTIWIGPDAPSHVICDAFTRVLKGHIGVARAIFPYGTPGYKLDPVARYALWQAGLDYNHGTGHGVGSFLSVHEGPQNIGTAPRETPLLPGMIVSNEPGYYEPGHYGIRLENLLAVRDVTIGNDRRFLGFETLNFAPFDRNLVNVELLTRDELDWLNAYHAKVHDLIAPLLDDAAKQWLTEACAPL